jgi:phosphopantetheinyl transferase (holo-ACP synthase)
MSVSCRWAIKEAAYKSLFPNIKTTFKSFDLRRTPSGQPVLHLVHPYIPMSGLSTTDVHLLASLSHDVGAVVGVVIAQLNRGS